MENKLICENPWLRCNSARATEIRNGICGKTSLGDNENQRQNHSEHESLTPKEINVGESMQVHGPRPNGELKIYR
jgi:hypothetical protein